MTGWTDLPDYNDPARPRPWLADRPAPPDPLGEGLLAGYGYDHACRYRTGLFATWRAALPVLLVCVVALALWAGGWWLVAWVAEVIR